jgi:putative lipoic acid-binding regulatory protein
MSQIKDLLEFPCTFNLKIMGISSPDLIAEISAIIKLYCVDFNGSRDIKIRQSRKGNYTAVTAVIQATSRKQLEQIYFDLNQHHLIKITL